MGLGWTSRQRWWMIAGAWLALLLLGIWGFVRQADALDLDVPFLDHLYFTLQLAALSYEGPSEAINWQLQIARFAAPVLAAGTLLQSASVVFREQFGRWRARRAKDHTIVIGLDGIGVRLVEALVADGRKVVAVESDSTAPGVSTAHDLDVAVVYGDPTEPAVLAAAGVGRASRVVAATVSDGVNVAIASTLRSLDLERRTTPLRCSVRLTDGDLARLLRNTELTSSGSTRVDFFNVHERAAHTLIATHPLSSEGGAAAHLLLFGLGQFGGAVLLGAAQRWAERGVGPLTTTIVDRAARGRLKALTMRHPALGDAVEAVCIDLEIDAPDVDEVTRLEQRIAADPPTLAVIAFQDETESWTSGLFVRRWLMPAVDVVVRTNSDGGLGQQLESALPDQGASGERHGGRIVPVPIFANAGSIDLIEGGVREQLARSIHEDYLAGRGGTGTSPFDRPWAELSDADRESSRTAADAIVGELERIGCDLQPLRRWGAVDAPVSDADIESLAVAEHSRWKADRERAGWTYGATRDDGAKKNPLLVEWGSLSDEARAQNLHSAAQLPARLARAGFEIHRR